MTGVKTQRLDALRGRLCVCGKGRKGYKLYS